MLTAIIFSQWNTLSVRAEESWPEGPEINGETAIVMEASTGTILYEKNIHEEHFPASITKIMTALLALENSSLDEEVVFSRNAVYSIEGAHIARDVDEVMPMEECLYALLLASANECAYAIAEHVGGDYDTFIRMMNEKATELGCQNTHFNNPHGLPDEEHYTSVYDMALIAREAMKNETFRLITGTKIHAIPPTNKHSEETYVTHTHRMLTSNKGSEYLYDGCIGGKTGYTDTARNTLVTFAERDGMTLICVVMHEGLSNQYHDTAALLDFCFDNFQVWNVTKNEKHYTLDVIRDELSENETEIFSLDQDANIVLPKTAVFTDASVELVRDDESEDRAGTVAYTYADRQVGGTDIIVTKVEVPELPAGVLQTQEETETEAEVVEESTNIKYILLWILLVVVVLGAGAVVYFRTDRFYWIRHKIMYRRQDTLKRIQKSRRKHRNRRRRSRR